MRNQFVPSPTALLSAAARAAHCLYDDQPHLIDDTVAVRLCEKSVPQALEYHRSFPSEPILAAARLSACMRRRFAESVARDGGFSQCILLGGGLDAAIPQVSRTWVVDLPEVITWRRELFAETGIVDRARLVPADLRSADLEEVLEQSSVDGDTPVLVVWLGVSMYLDRHAIERILHGLATLLKGSTVVFDYVLPRALRDERGSQYVEALGAQVARGGEPWKCVLTPGEVRDILAATGWDLVRDIPEKAGASEAFWPRTDGLEPMSLIRFAQARLIA